MKQKILALWAVPRSTSTAFERMMRERGDFLVLDEPFGLYFHYSEERKSDRYPQVEKKTAYNFYPLLQDLIDKAQRQPVFIKDMARFICDRADEEFISHFEHTFMIRHPAKALPSLFAIWPDFSLQEAGYAELYQLFELVKTIQGKTPLAIDSDDLIQYPEKTVKAYCDSVNIPYLSDSLTWESEIPSDIHQWEGSWHGEVQSSQGLAIRKRKKYADIAEHEHLQNAYDFCLPYYQKLYEHRLVIE
ncbi:hypothetical protein [Roseofilum casamattae]|uniref:Sulfotransferase family protein n=1 Tax=Roseofilum casamattae BLCC-M143 TaxID=3022442 RepID=A0ABT7BW33_9CYAN|nr:hypothetical protein [Roseofilum casamattae]MDJ1183393.1 sulfotransferase family protein [Roseofilum casamattae BLCC-M143]